MNPELVQQILFWAAVVFIAGFIGYFGKYLSKLILGKIHKKGLHGPKKGEPGKPMGKRDYDYLIEKQKLKLEKKRMKAEEKRKEAEEKRREKEAERREKMREKREKD
ncbi:MAG: hypothetical protein JSV39_02110 [Candidatus Aenigmatarchaeota archaeon]|nr:MAG: hypothetical protein JSV39_02110 [Candidatus Aenigmarchaeota archaeon]